MRLVREESPVVENVIPTDNSAAATANEATTYMVATTDDNEPSGTTPSTPPPSQPAKKKRDKNNVPAEPRILRKKTELTSIIFNVYSYLTRPTCHHWLVDTSNLTKGPPESP